MESLSTTRLMSYFVLLVYSFSCLTSNGQLLPKEEVQALQTIAEKLHLKNFNFNQSFCSSGRVRNSTTGDDVVTDFICNPCNATFCHVTNIVLKGQNLTGTLPEEFGNLSYLQQIDLTRNYISGPIPTTFDQIPLANLSLLGNRINGSIPKELGNIPTLLEIILEDNDLEGTLPQNLGNLSNLRRILFSANNMTGTIPESYGKLTNLTDFRIDGSRISGTIPDFIGNWTQMNRLDLQGTLLNGPIPSSISVMKNITELRIMNLNATAIQFPDLSEMKQLKLLILRNCGFTGSIPDYLGGFTQLKNLDLSYNMFTGPIPGTFQNLPINYMFLNNNSLSGSVPNWILNKNQNYFDLSYNNFSGLSSVGCQASLVNLVASASPTDSNSDVSWCLKQDLSCSSKPKHYSMFINCGGDHLTYDNHEYEEDKGKEGPAYFGPSAEKWAYSSNGVFMGMSNASYKATNTFGLNITGGDIYRTARLAPNSLKYYGLCMRRGSYRVRLHFAEITYSDDQTFSSVGKRIFDVAIQGKVVLKDFNIAEKAKGVGKGITEDFPDIHVYDSTLEIHLYWSGKGTTAIPNRGVYGPLISAITVTPNFDVGGGLSAGVIAGIVIASCVLVVGVILLILWKLGYIGKDIRDKELAMLELQTGYFTLRQIKQATNNFDPVNKIGEGGFGPVYKGILSDGAVIAVKQLSSKSKQGNREFVNEIGMISALQHPNLVKLYGCCIEGNQLLLVYEYMENNSLARALFGKEEPRLILDWATRKKIFLGIAKGLFYLHEESRLKIVHRDIKATNVLLDKDLNAKISDFGLAKLDEDENTHISTRIAGTIGYMAPEYAMRGYLTDKADVYSFGIVALEIVSGKSNTNYRPKEEFVYLLDWAYVLEEQGSLLELVDPILGSSYSQKEATTMLNIALMCTNPSPTLRPSMSSVVSMLEGKTPIQAPVVKRKLPNEELRFKAFEMLSHDSETDISTFSREKRSMSMDGPWIDSSISSQSGFTNDVSSSRLIPDLRDVNLN